VTRRHRLHSDEVPEVKEGLKLRITEHLDTKDDLEAATLAFRALFRLERHKVGKPSYPKPITWGLIEDWINLEVWGEYGTIF